MKKKNIFFIRLKSKSPSFFKKIAGWFDLDLMRDGPFVNIIFGMAIATFAEMNFSSLTPFILDELNYTNLQISGFLSALATSDIVFRFLSPFIGDFFQLSPRSMYIISLILLVITRMSEYN